MTQQSREPDRYDLTGQGIQITYSTGNIDGQPQFRYQGSLGNKTLGKAEFRTQQSELGTLVSVTLQPSLGGTLISLTLLVPDINMAGQSQQPIETLAIQTTSAGPDTITQEARQSYQVFQLQGTAQFVT